MRGIRRSERFEGLVRQLAEAQHPIAERSIFPTMRELICFAAILGFEYGKRKELQGKTLEIDGRIFGNHQQSVDLLYLVALVTAKDADILREENEDEMIRIFEEFANGGLEILTAWLNEKPDDPHGDRAILAALQKYGFLENVTEVEAAIRDVSF